jgi:hypothetical protein
MKNHPFELPGPTAPSHAGQMENTFCSERGETISIERKFQDGTDYRIEIGFHDGEIEANLIGAKGRKSFAVCKPQPIPKPTLPGLRKQGIDPSNFFWAGYLIRNSARDFFDGLWAKHEAALDAEIARECAIEGLEELRAARADEDRYQRQFTQMMGDEYNDGVNPPRAPKAESRLVAARYPRAAMYLAAESYAGASHWAKAKAGDEAMEIILAGGTIEDARAKLDHWMEDNGVEVD